jgi:histidyl-tRNA synthetase
MSKINKIKGFADLFPPQSSVFVFMEEKARQVFKRYGCKEIRIPVLEKTELFARTIGDETDIVQKEMYTFLDRKKRSLTLRPEATAGVLRAYIESQLHSRERVSKLFTVGPMFRYERPQKGRLRQFHQMDVEVLGTPNARVDAELMAMGAMLFEELEQEAKLRVQEIDDQMAVLRQDVERTRELLTKERDHRLKVVLPKRFTLLKGSQGVRVLPLAVTYLIPATREDVVGG